MGASFDPWPWGGSNEEFVHRASHPFSVRWRSPKLKFKAKVNGS